MTNLWNNRTVVIVGAGSGLGIALARRFAAEGCAVGGEQGPSDDPLLRPDDIAAIGCGDLRIDP